MPVRDAFEYAVLRVVPSIERGECINAGVILICRPRRFLDARVALDRPRLLAIAPWLIADDPTIGQIDAQLALVPRICAADPTAGPIAALSMTERWHWLSAPASTIVQPGPVHTGLCPDPAAMLDRLFDRLVLVADQEREHVS